MGRCEITSKTARNIKTTLSRSLIKQTMTIEGVANSLKEVIGKNFIIDDDNKLELRDIIINWAETTSKQFEGDIQTRAKLIKDKVDDIIVIAASDNQSIPTTDENPAMRLINEEYIDSTKQVEFIMLNDLYGTAQQARTEMQNKFRQAVIASLYVDFTKGKIVSGIADVNKNIVQFQEQLWQTIREYAKKIKNIEIPEHLFDDEGNYIKPRISLVELAKELFGDFTAVKLNGLFSNRTLPNIGLQLDAYNAWVILNNFDMLIKNLLGKSIIVNEQYKGTFQDASKQKYQISNQSNLIKTWRASENISAIDELGSITKLLIESAPMYQYDKRVDFDQQVSEQLYGQTLETKDVMYAFSEAQQHPNLKNEFMKIRYNPMVYIPRFIELALSQKFSTNDQQIKNILYSVYKRFFELNHKDGDQYSLVQIMNSESSKVNHITTDNLLSYITGMIDKTIPNNHIEYAIDSDTGYISTRFTSANSLNTSKIMVQKTINNINDVLNEEDRKDLLSQFDINLANPKGIVKTEFVITFKYNGKTYKFKFNNKKGSLKAGDFFAYDDNDQLITLDKNEARDALLYLIDSTLQMSLKDRTEILDQLYDLMAQDSTDQLEVLKQVALLSGRVLVKHWIESKKKVDIDTISSYYGTETYQKPWLNQKTGKILSVVPDKQSSDIITKLAQAQMIVNGDIAKRTVRNLEGNAIAAEGLTNLINTVRTVWEDASQQEDSANRYCIFGLNPSLLHNITIKSAAQSSDRLTVRADKDFNIGESGYSAIMLDFLTGYAMRLNDDGSYVDGTNLMSFQPTVYSDKTTNSLLVINGSTVFDMPDGSKKRFIDMSPAEIQLLHFNTMSDMYNQLKTNILEDYQFFLDKVLENNGLLETSIRTKEVEQGFSGVLDSKQFTWEYFSKVVFPAVNEFANTGLVNGTIFDKGNGERKTAVQVFDEIIKPRSKVVVNVHYSGSKNLETNPVLDYHFKMYNKTDIALYLQQVKRNQARFAKHCLQNFKIDWTNSKLKIDPRLLGALARLGITRQQDIDNFIEQWVDTKTNRLILAKSNGKALTKVDAESNNFPNEVQLNPILEAFYSYDQIVSTQFITSTVGGCYGHKNNFGSSTFEPGTIEYMEEQEAGRTLTQFKRMVIYPATMHNYQQELITGCATTIQVANIADISAHVFNFLRDQKDIDAHDGSGFCLPWVSYWENGSLGDAAAGDDKKTIGHHMDGRYLMESEFKWALYTLTNERIRNSGRTSGITLKDVVRRMSDKSWNTFGSELDITKTYLGEEVSLVNFGKRIIFQAQDQYINPSDKIIPGHHYQVNSIRHVGQNQYKLVLCEVDETGTKIGEDFVESQYIDSNYKLWQVFGAEYSEEVYTDHLGNTSLMYSDTSSQLVAYFGNNAGFLRTRETYGEYGDVTSHPDQQYIYDGREDIPMFRPEEELRLNPATITQRDVYQPMKYSDISYLVNVSAVKNGQTNVNPATSWYDESEFTTFQISTKHFGIQMDADHHADDAELTEMTQVISALESNGYTHDIAKEAYRDLGAIVYAQLKPYIEAINLHYQGNSRQLYEVVGKIFLESFKNSSNNRSDLADKLIYNLKQRLGDGDNLINAGVYIPFSDTAVLSKLIANITSQINKTAIKRKYAGIAAVMVPAYDLIKIYKQEDSEGNLIDSTFGGIVHSFGTIELAKEHLQALTDAGEPLHSRQIQLGRTYQNLTTGEIITFDKLDDYWDARNGNDLYREQFTQGRNLQPSRTTFTLIDEENYDDDSIYDIYDTDSVKNKVKFSRWYSKYKESDNKLLYLQTTWDELTKLCQNSRQSKNINKLLIKLDNVNITDVQRDFYVKQIGENLQQAIIEEFRSLHNDRTVIINGIIRRVNGNSIKVEEAELVLSKIYATKFGLKPGTFLHDINEQFFYDQIKGLLEPTNQDYDIALKKANGQHTYIVLEENINRLLELGLIEQQPPTKIIDHGRFRINPETGEIISAFNNCRLFVSEGGIEYIVTNNIQQFLDTDSYETIQVNSKYNPKRSIEILRESGTSGLLEDYKKEYKDVTTLLTTIESKKDNVIKRAAKRKWTSFQKSLEFTAARIPSQSMQSFMPMRVVGFTDSDENKAYVSHFQTFLQGSDYDIDKVYLLGNEFDSSGMYIGWSPLFDLSDIKLQKASEELPMPTGKEIMVYAATEAHPQNDLIEGLFVAKDILDSLDPDSEDYIPAKINFIKAISKFLEWFNEQESNFVYVDTSNKRNQTSRTEKDLIWLENIINRHQTYLERVSDDRLIKMTKNSVSSKIRRIINDPLNTVAAYSPIEMEAPKEAANKSTMGSEEREYSQMNPAVKWILHEQNMVGKKAIGITAVGEKVLFALQYYYNEIARTDKNSDIGKIKQRRAFFQKEFSIIKGTGLEKIKIFRNLIANINFSKGTENTEWDNYISKQVANIQQQFINGEITQEESDFMIELLTMQLSVMEDSALINSALLSAATDNAKELILSKINANPDMLKIYTYSIVLGIDFNYIADLMTSSTVTAISKLSRNSIFDPRYYNKRLDLVIEVIQNGINLEKYGITKIFNPNVVGAQAFNAICDFFNGNKLSDNEFDKKSFWQRLFENSINYTASAELGLIQLDKLENELLSQLPEGSIDTIKMYRYVEEVRELLNYMKSINSTDLNTFKQLLEAGDELNLFGRVLGINQGIRTNMADKISYLDNFEEIFAKRLKYYESDLTVSAIVKDKPYLLEFGVTNKQISEIIDKAIQLGMIEQQQIGNGKQKFISNFNALKFLQDNEYRAVAIEMYDLIKNTINIFDVIDTVPHFNAMTKAAAVDFVLFDENSSKFALAYNIAREVKASQRGLTKKQKTQVDRDVLNFLSQIITNKYFKRNGGTFITLNCGYYDETGEYHLNKDKEPILVDMSTAHGQATFKRWFETSFIPRLKKGYLSDSNNDVYDTIKNNKFIQDLLLTTTERTLTRDLQYIWTLPINMSNTSSTTDINNFVGYLGAFTVLENYDYQDMNIVKLFAWYNLLVYKNQYGQDSLTRIFENYMVKPNNVMQDYFDYVGKLDYDKLLISDDFNIEDVKINCAPEVSIWDTLENRYLGDYIKVRDKTTGTLVIYKYNSERAEELRRQNHFNSEYNDMEEALRDVIGENDDWFNENTPNDIRPLVYDPVPILTKNKQDIINNFSIITPSSMIRKTSRSAISILQDLFKQGKIFIYNNCG